MKISQETEFPFLGGGDLQAPSWEDARVVVLPIPYEQTVSFGTGTEEGPWAILETSSQVELFDDELKSEPYKCGIFTATEVDFRGATEERAMEIIESNASEVFNAGKFLVGLGGEHSVTTGLVRAARKKYPDLSVVHFDAHADMRPEYEGSKWSHASVMHRIYEMGVPFTSIGIRELSAEEYKLIQPMQNRYFFACDIAKDGEWMKNALDIAPSGPVYLTFDVDVFDSSVIPHTGTPSPGGLSWYQATGFIRALMETRQVVGADIVELSPDEYSASSDFTIAKLTYKIIGYWWKGLKGSN